MPNAHTQLAGVIGHPVGHSLSPTIHNSAYDSLDLNWRYLAFDVDSEDLGAAVNGLAAIGARGCSITVPHKVKVMDFLDEVDDFAQRAGAVNTIKFEGGHKVGYNTDGEGLLNSLREVTAVEEKIVAILGAGGAARAIAMAVSDVGSVPVIINRTAQKAEELAKRIRYARTGELEDVHEADIVVNATSVGLGPQVSNEYLVDAVKFVHASHVVVDIVYTPLETEFLKQSTQRGATTIDGLGMLVHQAALQFKLWTGHDAPIEVMKSAALSSLKAK